MVNNMLSFKEFLAEAKYSNSGSEGLRHAEKYFADESEKTIGTKFGNFNPGDQVKTSGFINKNGKFHAVVHHNGEEHYIPFSHFEKSTAKSGKYSDEHAFVNVWNHLSNIRKQGNAKSHDLDVIHDEIEKAKKDPTHPLSYHNSNNLAGFTGKSRANTSESSYYNELKTAAHTIHDLAKHDRFKHAIENGHVAEVTGAAKGNLSNLWKRNNAGNPTSKADIHLIDPTGQTSHRISYKKAGGSQLMSGSPSEMIATYEHAANTMLNRGHISQAHHNEIMHHVKIAANHISNLKGLSDAEKTERVKAATSVMKQLHAKFDHKDFYKNEGAGLTHTHARLNNFVHHEAASGEGKFGGSGADGTANYIVTSHDPKTGSTDIHHVNDYLNTDPTKLGAPRPAKPKDAKRADGNHKIDVKKFTVNKAQG